MKSVKSHQSLDAITAFRRYLLNQKNLTQEILKINLERVNE